MKIIEIIKDIFDDMDHSRDGFEDMYRSAEGYSSRRSRRNAGDLAFLATIMPNIMGFLFGMALVRMVEGSGIAYLIMGIIGAIGIGTLYSNLKQGIALKYALLRHTIIVAGVAVLFGIVWLIDSD